MSRATEKIKSCATAQNKKMRHKKHPKLYLHNMLLYNSSFFSGVAEPRILPAGYISILCKIAARPTLAKGAVHLAPSTLVGQWVLAPKPLRQKPLLGLPSSPQTDPVAEVGFMPLPPVRQGQSLRQVGASQLFDWRDLPSPKPPGSFFCSKHATQGHTQPKRTSIKKTFTFLPLS